MKCREKKVFYSKQEAEDQADIYSVMYRKPFFIYRCDFCNNYHLSTTLPKKKKNVVIVKTTRNIFPKELLFLKKGTVTNPIGAVDIIFKRGYDVTLKHTYDGMEIVII